MANTVALITGANKGIGLETARQLGTRGITVVLGGRDLTKVEEAAAILKAEGLDVHAIQLNVIDATHHIAAAEFLNRTFGKLDILVNNAGVMLDKDMAANHTSETPAEVLRATFETNFLAPVALTQALLPLLRMSEAGRIVNLSSVLGSLTLHATPGSPVYEAKPFAYDASKAALNMFTIHLAHELRDTKIKVNSAHPGWVKTDMGTDAAPMELMDGAKTSVQLSTLGADGPTGTYQHMGQTLPW